MDVKNVSSVKAVFIDLDGTLLQVEMEEFIPAYISGLSRHFADIAHHYTFCTTVRTAISALLASENDDMDNKELFFAVLKHRLGIDPGLFDERLARYCADGLASLKSFIHPLPQASRILECCRERGLAVILATNPVFPRPLVDARLAWGGIGDFPFDLVTSIENTRYCKPDPRYFRDLLKRFGLAPAEAVMVGNDTEHDLAASEVGIATFLVDTWLADRCSGNFRTDYRGGHPELLRFLEGLGSKPAIL